MLGQRVCVVNRPIIPESLRTEVIAKASNSCCVCQTPFIEIHHIDGNPSNNDPANLAPVCPNCHHQAHTKGGLAAQLTPQRIEVLRDYWYAYCEKRKESGRVRGNAVLKVKNFVNSVPWAKFGWGKTFSAIDPSYENKTRDQIINEVFSTSNRDDIVTNLEAMKHMYSDVLASDEGLERFKKVCHAFGVDYDELD